MASPTRRVSGQVFGLWTVLRDLRPDDAGMTGSVWVRCACGSEKSVKAHDLLTGRSSGCKSCVSGPRTANRPPAPARTKAAIRQAAFRTRRAQRASGGGESASGAGGAA